MRRVETIANWELGSSSVMSFVLSGRVELGETDTRALSVGARLNVSSYLLGLLRPVKHTTCDTGRE